MENEQIEQNKLVAWETEEFETHQRDVRWYLVGGSVVLLIAACMVYIRNWILLAVVLMLGVMLYLSGRLKPRVLKCIVDKNGVTVGERSFNYNQLKTFWFSKDGGRQKLNLIATVKWMPVVSLTINSELEDKIRDILSQFLPESKNKREDWIDRVNRFLKL